MPHRDAKRAQFVRKSQFLTQALVSLDFLYKGVENCVELDNNKTSV